MFDGEVWVVVVGFWLVLEELLGGDFFCVVKCFNIGNWGFIVFFLIFFMIFLKKFLVLVVVG